MERGWLLKVFREGMVAGKSGLPTSRNPHPPNSDLAEVWIGGWKEGANQNHHHLLKLWGMSRSM